MVLRYLLGEEGSGAKVPRHRVFLLPGGGGGGGGGGR